MSKRGMGERQIRTRRETWSNKRKREFESEMEREREHVEREEGGREGEYG
jgi:hypothetical protein